MKAPGSPQLSKGFTLLELLTVIFSLAVLMVLAGGLLANVRRSALQAKCLSNLRSYGVGVLAFAGENNGFPRWKGTPDPQPVGSVRPNFELWLRPYLHGTRSDRLRCPLVPRRLLKTPNAFESIYAFNYTGNGALCIYYPKLTGIPIPANRVALAAEVYGIEGFNHSVHFQMTMWGVSEMTGYGNRGDFESNEGQTRLPQYHGTKERRSLNMFFLDGHAEAITPVDGNWKLEPIYGTPTNGGYYYSKEQFLRLNQ